MRRWLITALMIAAGPAFGQTKEEIDKAAGSQMQAYMWCVRYHAAELARADTGATDKQVKARANLAWPNERKALYEQLQKAPLNISASEATRHMVEALEEIEPDMSDSKSRPYGTFAHLEQRLHQLRSRS
jgi:hypothetical protein